MSSVLISGGTGLIGQRLCQLLQEKGYDVAVLSRRSSDLPDIPIYTWDPDRQVIDRDAVNSCDYMIHLAGVNIGGKRWTRKRKRQIHESRIQSAGLIFDQLDPRNSRLKAFISSSAIGYYGARTSDKIYRENDLPAPDFLGRICDQWEQAADRFSEKNIRTVKIRTGIVLSKKGGALKRMQPLFRLGLGSAIGHGKQYMPWIHLDDLCRIYIRAMEQEEMQGAYNAVAPEHITNSEFSRKLARVLGKPFWFPRVPAFAMKMLFGNMSVLLLTGSRISSEKIEAAGFQFQHPRLEEALRNIYSV